jgi:isopenicillin-N N-acyltransferase like protein
MERMYQVVDCRGNAYELGRQWGEGCREINAELLRQNLAYVMKEYNVSRQEILHEAMKFFPLVEQYDPYFLEMLEGQASALGVRFEEILFYRCIGEIKDYYQHKEEPLCSTVGVTGKATADGLTLLGQNIDWSPYEISLIKFHHNSGLDQLAISLGNYNEYLFNSFGVGVCMNSTGRKEEHCSFRMPSGCYLHKVMRQKDTQHAMELLKQVARGFTYFQLADADGQICGIESISDDFEILYPERDVLLHTNHYLTPRFRPGETPPEDSFCRLERLRTLVHEHYGQITPEILMQIFASVFQG